MSNLDNIRIVLVETTHPGNIGAAARAMKNMGLHRLYLVAPRSFPHEKAIWRSAGAADLVESAVVVDSLEEAIGDCQIVFGTSARERRIPWPLVNAEQAASALTVESDRHECAVVFGREARGLTNDELQRCQFHLHIPTMDEYSSLNLAMAVQIVCYEIRKNLLAQSADSITDGPLPTMEQWDQDLATQRDAEFFLEHLEKVLIKIGFHDPGNPRQLISRLRRLFLRVRLDVMEVNILRGILTAVEKKLPFTKPETESEEQLPR